MDSSKKHFVFRVQDLATQLANIAVDMQDAQGVYDTRQYGPGAANAITDSELGQLENEGFRTMTADQLYSYIIFCNEFKAFLQSNGYAGSLNFIRTDL